MTKLALPRRALVVAGGCALAAPALIGRARAATTLKISTSFPNDPKFSTARIWYDLFIPKLKDAVGDQIAIQFFPDNQLGQEADVVNQVKLGVVDAMLVGTSIWTNLVPEFGAFDLGYLFQDFAHQRRACETPEGTALSELLVQKAGARVGGWGRNLGARNFLTKFSFNGPDQLAGKKIRSLPSPIVTETVKLMGAAATPMAFGEIYTALQAGVIDGLEHDAPTILASKFYEAAKYFTLTRHIYTPFCCFLSERTLHRLAGNLRDGLMTAVKQATNEHTDRAAKIEADAVDNLKQLGVTVGECDRNVFRDRVKPLWTTFTDQTPGAKPFVDATLRVENA
ncbi:MAG: TRAP transporter substrate-binding protein [Acetobacteraceae bacterium]|nr:TRAP transporter substrate-binding protein [Acetobacteraceae bacterium]